MSPRGRIGLDKQRKQGKPTKKERRQYTHMVIFIFRVGVGWFRAFLDPARCHLEQVCFVKVTYLSIISGML